MAPAFHSSERPSRLGYAMPAEWESHAATWLTWPRPNGISFPGRYRDVLPVLGRLVRELAEVEAVHINVWDHALEQLVMEVIRTHHADTNAVHLHPFPAYEPWCRDHGPIFVVRDTHNRRKRAVIDWQYNAWGGKYPPFDLDDAIPVRVAEFLDLPLFSPPMVLEGGAIDVNGAGCLITTESCLLNSNRNPARPRRYIEQCLRDHLGVSQILWLGDGIEGDDTDGHVDDLTRFVSPNTLVSLEESNPNDPNFMPLRENWRRLEAMRDTEGNAFRLVPLPTPGVLEYRGQRLPASYANFYIANQKVIVPTFDHPNDRRALATLQSLFPNRCVLGIDSRILVWGLGSFHCLTQQEPDDTPPASSRRSTQK